MLKRKTPLKAKAPMARKPIKQRRRKAQSAKQKDVRWRSEQYLAFVRSLPCSVCGATEGVAAHHITGMYQLSGMGLKPADSFAMPACDPIYKHNRDCHQQIHANKALRDMQPTFLRTTLRAGLKQFTGETAEALMHALAFLEAQQQ
ncbi:DUF968 domain-containing protein [Halomonas sp. H2]|uniref:DUF968 domain-containing protein n=1 Tax=unclassified Halomonas TaxID=2609666 RepID=UPI003CF73BDE